MNNIFNNREIASGIWLGVAFLFLVKHKKVRHSIGRLIRSFCHWKILVSVFAMIGYVGLCVLILYWMQLWNKTLLKDTIYWIMFSSLVCMVNLTTIDNRVEGFRKLLLDNLKLVVFLEFLVNFYQMSIYIELLLVPIIAVLAMVSALTEHKQEDKDVHAFVNGILGILGLVILVWVARSIYLHYVGLLEINILLSILLPLFLAGMFVPFLYAVSLIVAYEYLFARLLFIANKDKKLTLYIKKRVLKMCHFNIYRLDKFAKGIGQYFIDNKSRADEILDEFAKGKADNA